MQPFFVTQVTFLVSIWSNLAFFELLTKSWHATCNYQGKAGNPLNLTLRTSMAKHLNNIYDQR